MFSIVSPERLISISNPRPFEFADKCLIPQSLAGYEHHGIYLKKDFLVQDILF